MLDPILIDDNVYLYACQDIYLLVNSTDNVNSDKHAITVTQVTEVHKCEHIVRVTFGQQSPRGLYHICVSHCDLLVKLIHYTSVTSKYTASRLLLLVKTSGKVGYID